MQENKINKKILISEYKNEGIPNYNLNSAKYFFSIIKHIHSSMASEKE